MNPDTGPARPVRTFVPLRILPKSAGHPDPWGLDHQFADPPADRSAVFVEHVGSDPRARGGEGTRLQRQDRVPHQDPTRDLGTARVVDDGPATFSDGVEKPHPGLWVPRLAGGGE